MLKIITQNLRYIQNAWRESRWYTGSIVLLEILVNCVPALKIFVVGHLIDDTVRYQELGQRAILLDALWIVLVYLVEYLLAALQSYLNYKFTLSLNNQMEDRFYQKLSSIQYALLEDNENNDLVYQVKDGIEKKFAEGFGKILEFAGLIVRVGSIVAIVVSENVLIGLIFLSGFVLLAPLYRKIGEENYEAYAEANKEYRLARNYRQILTEKEYANEREVFSYTDFFSERWKKHYHSAIEKSLKASGKNHVKILTVTALISVMTTVLSGILLPVLPRGEMTLGVYVVIVTQLYNLVHFMSWNFSYMVDDLTENQLYLEDYDSFLRLREEIPQEKEVAKGDISISVEHLSFRYPNSEEDILKDISYEFTVGKHYAIVGKNGAGKTTLVKLLLGLYDTYAGSIRINGIEVRELSKTELQKNFSTVFQDYAKYALSVKENVLLKESDDEKKKQQAELLLKKLGIRQEIQQLKADMETSLGKIDENGVDLSGGQWQKLAIARGAVKDAGVYILDEPSASLDPVSEKQVYDMYNHIFKNRTTILITHRLGNTKEQDEILVLDEGKLVEHGSHKKLMETQTLYYDMYMKQRSWYHEA